MTRLAELLACPRCDKTPLESIDGCYRCKACDVAFPLIDGIPWMFADPDSSLGEWQNRLHMSLKKISHEITGLDSELEDKHMRKLTRQRIDRYRKALVEHRQELKNLLEPLDLQSHTGNFESYLALRTRLPADQGLNTYYANVHRDWSWGDEENEASLNQVRAVTQDGAELGVVLVLGAGAGRLAYDIHSQLRCTTTTALDFNPLLLLIAKRVAAGEEILLHEFPIAPKAMDHDAILRKLKAPGVAREGFELVLGDALRPPFANGSFDTVVTPWLVDIVTEDLPVFAARINALLKTGGRWVNFGSLAFAAPERARRYLPEEVVAIVAEGGFSDPLVSEATIPYMCSPASRHGRRETVFSFAAVKERDSKTAPRHRALPDWLVTGRDPVPLSPSFRTQAMKTQIYSFMMSLIDGKRSIDDMATVLENRKLMTKAEAIPAIRTFLTKMYDDEQRQGLL